MRAILHDAMGPRAPRFLLPVLSAFTLLLAIATGFAGAGDGAVVLYYMAGLLAGIAPILPARFGPRTVELRPGAGYVDVLNAGLRTTRITAREVQGASTARNEQGYVLTLSLKDRKTPLSLELSTLDEVKHLQTALGIGHDGYGTLLWPTTAPAGEGVGAVLRLLGGVAFAGALVMKALGVDLEGDGGTTGVYVLANMAGALSLGIGLLVSLAARSEVGQYIAMRSDGLHLFGPRGWQVIPFTHLAQMRELPDAMHVDVHGTPAPLIAPTKPPIVGRRGLGRKERAVVIAQVLSAAQRAQGGAAPKPEVETRVDVLRKNGENARNWLARLDMTAQTLDASGYRGGSLEEKDLWTLLEDPDAEPEMRAAAARVLARARPQSRVRIDGAIAAVRDEKVELRLRIAVTADPQQAGAELLELEALEEPRRVHQQQFAGPQVASGHRWP